VEPEKGPPTFAMIAANALFTVALGVAADVGGGVGGGVGSGVGGGVRSSQATVIKGCASQAGLPPRSTTAFQWAAMFCAEEERAVQPTRGPPRRAGVRCAAGVVTRGLVRVIRARRAQWQQSLHCSAARGGRRSRRRGLLHEHNSEDAATAFPLDSPPGGAPRRPRRPRRCSAPPRAPSSRSLCPCSSRRRGSAT
jgi:hypothetical protein